MAVTGLDMAMVVYSGPGQPHIVQSAVAAFVIIFSLSQCSTHFAVEVHYLK